MEMKRNVEGKDNRIIEVESRYFHVTCDKKIESLRYTQNVTLNTRKGLLVEFKIALLVLKRWTASSLNIYLKYLL